MTVQYLLPFDPDTAHQIWTVFTDRFLIEGRDGTHVSLTRHGRVEDIATTCRAAWLARDIGDTDRFEALLRWADTHYEPRVDEDLGEFAYWFGLDETYPRGQWNNTIMNALVAPPQTWSSITR